MNWFSIECVQGSNFYIPTKCFKNPDYQLITGVFCYGKLLQNAPNQYKFDIEHVLLRVLFLCSS